jgi:glycosyltransferase involved in cell wall biosynthesis
MSSGTRPPRILGLSTQDLAGFRTTFSRYAGLFVALDRRYDVVGFVRPILPRGEFYWRMLCSIDPRRSRWAARTGLSPWSFHRRTSLAEEELELWEGRYDAIIQLQTLFAAGVRFEERPYAIYTDNVYPLMERFYPRWVPVEPKQGSAWAELERMTCQHARVVFAMSEFVRRSIIADYGCDPERVVRVGGGANLIANSVEVNNPDSQIALFVGDKFEIKGGATLLAAWDVVKRRLPHAELWIVGPKRRYGPHRPGVRWAGYIADRQMLADFYTRASVFVLPSHFEAWGHAFLEAMGHGLPCIGTNQCAMPEIIQDGVTGLLVPPRDFEALAEALVTLLSDPTRASSMGRRAHHEILTTGTWDHVVNRMAPHLEAMPLSTARPRRLPADDNALRISAFDQ